MLTILGGLGRGASAPILVLPEPSGPSSYKGGTVPDGGRDAPASRREDSPGRLLAAAAGPVANGQGRGHSPDVEDGPDASGALAVRAASSAAVAVVAVDVVAAVVVPQVEAVVALLAVAVAD